MPILRSAPPCRIPAALLTSVAAVVLAGCAPADGAPPASGAASADGSVVVDNCGVEVRLESPPEQIVTIKSSTTEMVLALGLEDRLAGAAFLDGPIPSGYGVTEHDLPVLS